MKFEGGKLLLALFCGLVLSCSKEGERNIDDECIIDKIISEEFIYDYRYNVNGDLFFINQEFLLAEPNPSTLRVYVKSTSKDTVAIGRLTNSFQQDPPIITAKYDDGNLIMVRRFFQSGETNILSFEHTPEKIRITVDYDSGQGTMQNVSFGDYYWNEDGNIERVEKYEYGADPNVAELLEEKSFTYDTANNPWKGLLFPVFLCPELPKARLFSTNNIKTVTTESEFLEYGYEYLENKTIAGDVFDFNACSSTEERVQETYSYIEKNN